MIGPERNPRGRWRQLTDLVKLIERRFRRTEPSAKKNQPPSPLQNVNENTSLLLKRLAVKAKEDLRIGRSNLWRDVFALAIELTEVVACIRTRLVGLNQCDVGRRRFPFRNLKLQRDVKNGGDGRLLGLWRRIRYPGRPALAFSNGAFSAASSQHSEQEG